LSAGNDEFRIKSGNRSAETLKKQYDRILDRSFTEEEAERLRREGVSITVAEMDENVAGAYGGYSKGKHHIIIDKGALNDDEALTHELVHALKEKDTNYFCGEMKKKTCLSISVLI